MKQSEFLELCDIVRGDFEIRSGSLFYKGKKISSEGEVVFASSEEVFFLFDVEKALSENFSKVILLNFRHCVFFKCTTVLADSRYLQFKTIDGRTHAYCLTSYQGSQNTKAVGSNFQNL